MQARQRDHHPQRNRYFQSTVELGRFTGADESALRELGCEAGYIASLLRLERCQQEILNHIALHARSEREVGRSTPRPTLTLPVIAMKGRETMLLFQNLRDTEFP